MFKAIKEFFVGKPKVEEVKQPEVNMATTTPPVEEVKLTTVTLNDQITDAVTLTVKSDTIPTNSWPFPGGDKPEEQKKKRTFVKREEPATTKKPVPAIKAKNTKTRKKK